MDAPGPNSAVHIVTFPLRWLDFDRFGHVTNSAYVEFAQEARLKFGRDLFQARGMNLQAFVRHIELDYLRPLLPWATEVTVESYVTNIGRTSYSTHQEIKDPEGRVCCVVDVVSVAVDLPEGTSRALTDREQGLLETLTPPSELPGPTE